MGSIGAAGLSELQDLNSELSQKTEPAQVQAVNVSQFGGTTVTLGQKSSTSSIPVVLASDQGITIDNASVTVDLDKAGDSVAIWSNTAKDGSGTAYQPILDSDGHLQIDALSLPAITGSVTANAGTNLNTSLLALESGGNLATIAGAISGTEMQVDVITMPTVTVQATDLDIRNLSHTQDSVLAEYDPGTIDAFGNIVTGSVNNQIDVQFYRDTVANLTTVTTANGGTASATNGMATWSATTTASSRAKSVSLTTTVYTGGSEIYAIFTAGFTGTGSGTSYHRIGLYNDFTDGFFIGYEAGTFGISILKGGSQTQTAKASFNVDTLVGGAGSKFTRAGTPEAIDLTKLNVWRIRFGWVGSAPINFDVLSPDGTWVNFHTIRQPNLAALPSVNTADLSFTADVNSGNSGTALTIISNCWGAGTTQALQKINAAITSNTLARLGRSVIAGETTAGGGSFVNVKVNPSGALTAAVTAADGDVFVRSNAASTFPVNVGLVNGEAVDVGAGTEAAAIRVTLPTDGTGVVNVKQTTGTNLHAVIDSGTITTITNAVTVNSHAVTNAGTFAVQDSQVVADNTGFTDGTTKVFMGGYIYDEVAGTALTENDAAAARINLNRAQVHIIEDGATRGRWATVSAANALKVDGSAVTQPVSGTFWQTTQPVSIAATVTVDTELPAAAALANDTASPTAPAVGSFNMIRDVGDGNWDMMTGIQAAPNLAAADSGVVAVGLMAQLDDTTPTAITENQFGNVRMSTRRALLVEGVEAHDAVAAMNPVRIGLTAETSPKGITLVADGDVTNAYADADGIQIVKLDTSGADVVQEAISDTGGTSTAFTNFGATASTYNYITSYSAFRTDTGTTMAYIDIRDGTAGAVLHRIPLPAGGGAISPPNLKIKSSSNTALAYDVSAALTTVYLSVGGFKSKV